MPAGGGIMLGTAGKDETAFGQRRPGNDAVYLVTDDRDGLFHRAVDADAGVVNDLADEDYGSRGSPCATPKATLGAS